MRRIVYIWLPNLPLDRLARQGTHTLDGAFALVKETGRVWRITHLNNHALDTGIRKGMTVSDARALCPDLVTEPDAPYPDTLFLKALKRWAFHFSPLVAVDSNDALVLDITGCAHLFGGERKMAKTLLNQLAGHHIQATLGIADTKGAAKGLALFCPNRISLVPCGGTLDALADLPVDMLEAPAPIHQDLRRAGLKTIGDISAIPTAELSRRYGLTLASTLHRLLGYAPDPVLAEKPEDRFAARLKTPDPIGYLDDILQVLNRLTDRVCGRLKQTGKGARGFIFTVGCVDTGDHDIAIGLAQPSHQPALILQQFQHPLTQLKIDYGADEFRLQATAIEALSATQQDLLKTHQAAQAASTLIATLGNRLGFDRVCQFQKKNSHLPERSFTLQSLMDMSDRSTWEMPLKARPVTLLTKPERVHLISPGRPPKVFQWRRQTYETIASKGPERLTNEWWRTPDAPTRDYWHVVTANGPRLWLMTHPGRTEPSWYVAGRLP